MSDDLFAWARTRNGRMRGLRRLLERHSQKRGKIRWLFGGPMARLSPWARTARADMRRFLVDYRVDGLFTDTPDLFPR